VNVTVTSEVTASPDAVRDELERVLGSEAFANAGRHTRLLRYVVDRTLAGEGDQLKEYVLGTEVFDRADSYDPRLDSIVRVEVRRLRNRLEEYYRGRGSADQVVISIPRGSYAPTFALRNERARLAEETTVATVQARPRSMVLLAIAVLLLLAVAAISRLAPGRSPAAQAAAGPSIAVLPFQSYSANESDVLLAARLTDAVTTELARLRTVSVASRTSASQYTSDARSVSEIRRSLNVDFLMEASAVNTDGSLQVTARMVDAARDRKIWVGEYTVAAAGIPSAARTIAREAAAVLLTYKPR
jgi:adenylate cyclase